MFKGLSSLAGLMMNAKEIGAKMQTVTEELKHKRAVGRSGGDLVEVEVNGLGTVLRVTVDQTLIENKDKEMIEELLPAAINAAVAKSKELHADALQNITGGMDMSGIKDMMSKFNEGGTIE